MSGAIGTAGNGSPHKEGRGALEGFLRIAAVYGIYIYIFFSFFDKGEAFRSLGLYGSLASWLVLALNGKVRVSFDVITVSFIVYTATFFLSAAFSIEPLYSFMELKDDVMKAIIVFLIISTIFDEDSINGMAKVLCLSGFVLLAMGLHSFITGRTSVFSSANAFLSVNANKYGTFIGLFFPFFLMYFFRLDSRRKKAFWGASSLGAMLATIFSASRGAIGNVVIVITIWVLFMFRKRSLVLIFAGFLVFALALALTFNYWPADVRNKLKSTPEHLSTFNNRVNFFWEAAIESVGKRPLTGWGYGSEIERDPRPFEGTKKPEKGLKGGLHSEFISVLFHQGSVGLGLYLALLASILMTLMKLTARDRPTVRLFAIAVICVIVGSFMANSFVKVVSFRRLAFFAGMSAALYRSTRIKPDELLARGEDPPPPADGE